MEVKFGNPILYPDGRIKIALNLGNDGLGGYSTLVFQPENFRNIHTHDDVAIYFESHWYIEFPIPWKRWVTFRGKFKELEPVKRVFKTFREARFYITEMVCERGLYLSDMGLTKSDLLTVKP